MASEVWSLCLVRRITLAGRAVPGESDDGVRTRSAPLALVKEFGDLRKALTNLRHRRLDPVAADSTPQRVCASATA